MNLNYLAIKAKALPKVSGCYLMKDSEGRVLYVGKAKNLNVRVSSYFQQSIQNLKTKFLVEKIQDFDFILTGNDAEAFVLENNLIKKFSPKYNIRLRDDKTYPYVVIDSKEPFPALHYMRRPKKKDGRLIFGPFAVGSNIFHVLRTIVKSFNLRDCSLREFHSRKFPCLLFQMRQCSAPCVGKISEADYDEDLKAALGIFKGKGHESLKILKDKMLNLAEREEFEHAAIVRDAILQIENFMENSQQKNVEFLRNRENVDVMAFYQGEFEVDIVLYLIREGVLLGSKNFHFPNSDYWQTLQDEVLTHLLQYYSSTLDPLPHSLILSFDGPLLESFQEALNKIIPTLKTPIQVQPCRTKYRTVMDLTQKLAQEGQRVRMEQKNSVFFGLNKLQELLNLKERPRVIECFDIAIWQGKSPTASQVVFQDGRPAKESYRYYHLEERPEGNNDFAMIEELISRRVLHKNYPDIFLIDGGPGQVNSVKYILKKHQLEIPVLGLAKARNSPTLDDNKKRPKSEERLFIPGRKNPYLPSLDPPLFRLLVQMRDEAHRFSRKLHHHAEKKRTFSSFLDDIPGIGPKAKQKILSQLKITREEIQKLSLEEMQKELKITLKTAEALKRGLEPKK